MEFEYLEHGSELYHYGVKGMKWGKGKKRVTQNSLSGPTTSEVRVHTGGDHKGNVTEYFPELALRGGTQYKEHGKAPGSDERSQEPYLYMPERSPLIKRKNSSAEKPKYRAAVAKYSNVRRSIVDAILHRPRTGAGIGEARRRVDSTVIWKKK